MSLTLSTLILSGLTSVSAAPTLLKPDGGPIRCEIWDTVSRTTQALAPEQTEVRAVLTDGIAEVEVVQTFVTPLPYSTEAKYVFPLPNQGAIHGMKYRQAGKWRTAEILPKETAQSIYDSVRQSGGSAALLTQQRADIFTQSLAKIVPGDTVEVHITLSMPLGYKDGNFEFAFPTMIGARCCNESTPPIFGTLSGWNPPANIEGPRIRFLVALQTGFAIRDLASPTHPIQTLATQAALDTLVAHGLIKSPSDLPLAFRSGVMLQPLNTYPNSDFVLRFSRATADAKASSAVWTDSTGWKYFRLQVFPDSSWHAGERPDMDVMLLLDRSGSQAGWPLNHEKAISQRIIQRLRPTDRICVMGFDNIHDLAFSDTIRSATAANIALANTYIQAQQSTGSTELYDAIRGLASIPNPAGRHRLYVFLTDGFITNETDILKYLGGLPDLQVITFGAGNNLNRAFLDDAALIGNGFSTPLVENDDLPARVDEAWGRIESPSLSGVHLDPLGLAVQDLQMGDGASLYKGLSWSVLGKTRASGKVHVQVVGARNASDTVRIPAELDLDARPVVGWAVPKLWARARIAELEREETRGLVRKDTIVAVSLEHQVLSKYTAFLAWDGSSTADAMVVRSSLYYSTAPTVGSSLPTEIRRGEISRPFAPGVDFRLQRDADGWRLELAPSLAGSDVRLVDLRGNVIWSRSTTGKASASIRLPARLPAFVVVQVRTGLGWRGRTLPTM